MKHEKSCGAVVVLKIDENYKVLLIQYAHGGHWAFPKGHTQKGEKETETALRKIKEKTGLNVVIDSGFRYVISYSPEPEPAKDVVYFIAETADDRLLLQAEEVRNAGWFSFEEAKKMITFGNDEKLFEAAESYIKSNYRDAHCLDSPPFQGGWRAKRDG